MFFFMSIPENFTGKESEKVKLGQFETKIEGLKKRLSSFVLKKPISKNYERRNFLNTGKLF